MDRTRRLVYALAFAGMAPPAVAIDDHNFESVAGRQVTRMVHRQHRELWQLRHDEAKGALQCSSCEIEESFFGVRIDREERFDRAMKEEYLRFGERLAGRVWDDPHGRRVRFDIEGRPGVGLVIPWD